MPVENKTIPVDNQLDSTQEIRKRITVINYDDQKTLTNVTSEAFQAFQVAMLSDKPFKFKTTNGDSIGTKSQHFDANPQIFQTLSELLNQQPSPSKRLTKRTFSPTDIQKRIDVGRMIFNSRYAGSINSLATRTSKIAEELFAKAKKGTPRSENPTIIVGPPVIDAICEATQVNIDNLFTYAISEGREQGKTEAEIIAEIERFADGKGIHESGLIENMAQFIGYVLRSFNESGGKPKIKNKELFDKTMEILNPSTTILGGAGPQMANKLNADGQNVCFMTQYNSAKQSESYGKKNNLPCIMTTEGTCSIKEISDPTMIREEDPDKISICMEHEEGSKILFNGKLYVAKKHDRVIIKSPGYFDKNNNKVEPNLTFNCSDETLEELAKRSPLFIINNLHNIQSYEQERYEETMTTLIRQFGIIKKWGAKIMIEISGDTSDMRFLSDLRGLIDFISLGGNEVTGVNKGLSKIHPEITTLPFNEENKNYFDIYQNGLSLLEVSQAEVINVHETEIDLTVMHATSKEELNRKTMANFHAKLKVYGHLMGLTPQELKDLVEEDKISSFLRPSGKLEILKFAVPYAKSLNLSLEEEEAVIYEIINTLSYYNPNGPSISLVPSKGLSGTKEIISTGAGDRTGAVTANEFYKHLKDEDNDYYYYLWWGRTKDLDLIA